MKKYTKEQLEALGFDEEEITSYLRVKSTRDGKYLQALIEREAGKREEIKTANAIKKTLLQPQQQLRNDLVPASLPQDVTNIQTIPQVPTTAGGPNVDDLPFAQAIAQYQALVPRPATMMWRGNIYTVSASDSPPDTAKTPDVPKVNISQWGSKLLQNNSDNSDTTNIDINQTQTNQEEPPPPRKLWGNPDLLNL